MSKILLVEADDLTRMTLAKALERCGHDVVVASTGREAIESLGTQRPDVIVTEQFLGGEMTGSKVLEHAALVSPDCARVLMSASNISRRIRLRGVHEVFLAKPFSMHVVAATLGDLSEHRRLHAA